MEMRFFWHCRSLGGAYERENDILVETRSNLQGQRVGLLFEVGQEIFLEEGKSGRGKRYSLSEK